MVCAQTYAILVQVAWWLINKNVIFLLSRLIFACRLVLYLYACAVENTVIPGFCVSNNICNIILKKKNIFQVLPPVLTKLSNLFHYYAPVRNIVAFVSILILLVAEIIDIVSKTISLPRRSAGPPRRTYRNRLRFII